MIGRFCNILFTLKKLHVVHLVNYKQLYYLFLIGSEAQTINAIVNLPASRLPKSVVPPQPDHKLLNAPHVRERVDDMRQIRTNFEQRQPETNFELVLNDEAERKRRLEEFALNEAQKMEAQLMLQSRLMATFPVLEISGPDFVLQSVKEKFGSRLSDVTESGHLAESDRSRTEKHLEDFAFKEAKKMEKMLMEQVSFPSGEQGGRRRKRLRQRQRRLQGDREFHDEADSTEGKISR